MMLPSFPADPGHSQSTSTPSKMPAADPGPPMPPQPGSGRFPLMNRSTQDWTKAWRDAGVRAASEKYLENDQPPIEISTLSPGWSAFSSFSCSKFPSTGFGQVTSLPLTESAAAHGFW
jgi:hypothetical protein